MRGHDIRTMSSGYVRCTCGWQCSVNTHGPSYEYDAASGTMRLKARAPMEVSDSLYRAFYEHSRGLR